MKEYVVDYAFELINPVDDKHGGFGRLAFSAERDIETAEEWKEVARMCFQQGKGNYRKVTVTSIGQVVETVDESVPEGTAFTEGEILE